MSQKYDDVWLSPVMCRVVEMMRHDNLTLIGFRDRKGKLRYILSNNELVHPQTVKSLLAKDQLELATPLEDTIKLGEVHYRIKT